MPHLRCLVQVEVSDAAVVGEQVAAAQQLRSEVNVTIVLEEAVVFELQGSKSKFHFEDCAD